MNKKSFILTLLGMFVLTGCSSVPKPITHEFTTQKVLQASEHWELLAKDFAQQTVATMMAESMWILKDDGSDVQMLDGMPSVYIQTNDLSDFGRTFRTYLITELTRFGYPVAHTPEGAIIANWSVRKIYHSAERRTPLLPGAGTATALLGLGVYKVIDSNISSFASVMAGGVAFDIFNSAVENVGGYGPLKNVPHTEIVLTSTVSKDSVLLSRQTQAYYVNAQDFNHYSNIGDFAGQKSNLQLVKFSVTN